MARSSLKTVSLVMLALLFTDAGVLMYVASAKNSDVGWWYVVGAITIQLASVAAATSSRLMFWRPSSSEIDGPLSYRSHWPMTTVGAVLVAIAFSLGVLYVAAACPSHAMPFVRGRAICA